MEPTFTKKELEVLHKIDLMQEDPSRRRKLGMLDGTPVSKLELTDKDLIDIGKALTSGFYGKLSLTQKAKNKLKQKALVLLEKAYYTPTTRRVQTVAQGSADTGASALGKRVQITSIRQKNPALVKTIEHRYAAYQLRDALKGKPANHWITSLMTSKGLTELRSKSAAKLAQTDNIKDLLDNWNQLDKAHRKDPVLFREMFPKIPQEVELRQKAQILMEAIDLHSKLPIIWPAEKRNAVALVFAQEIQTRPFPNILKPFLGGKETTSTDMTNFQGMLRSRLSADLQSYPGDADKTLESLKTRVTAYELDEFASHMHSISPERGRVADGIVNVLRQSAGIVSGRTAVDQHTEWPTIGEFIELHKYFDGSGQGKDLDGVICAETPAPGIPLTLSHLKRVNQGVIEHLVKRLHSLEKDQAREDFLGSLSPAIAEKVRAQQAAAAVLVEGVEKRVKDPTTLDKALEPASTQSTLTEGTKSENPPAPVPIAPKRSWGGATLQEQLDQAREELDRLRPMKEQLEKMQAAQRTAQIGISEKATKIEELQKQLEEVYKQALEKGLELSSTKGLLKRAEQRAIKAEASLEETTSESEDLSLEVRKERRAKKAAEKRLQKTQALDVELRKTEEVREFTEELPDSDEVSEDELSGLIQQARQLAPKLEKLSSENEILTKQLSLAEHQAQDLAVQLSLSTQLTSLLTDLCENPLIKPELETVLKTCETTVPKLQLLILQNQQRAMSMIAQTTELLLKSKTEGVSNAVQAVLEKHQSDNSVETAEGEVEEDEEDPPTEATGPSVQDSTSEVDEEEE